MLSNCSLSLAKGQSQERPVQLHRPVTCVLTAYFRDMMLILPVVNEVLNLKEEKIQRPAQKNSTTAKAFYNLSVSTCLFSKEVHSVCL